MSNSGRVYFSLRGDFNPADLTAAIGIDPTSSEMAGEHISGKAPKCSHWDFSSEVVNAENVNIYHMSKQIVKGLTPYRENIIAVARQYDLTVCLQVVLYITTDESISTPAIGFDPEVVDFLHAVGGGIDVDIYRSVAKDDSEHGI